MLPELHDNGWKSFGGGRLWRCRAESGWRLETDREGNVASYSNLAPTVAAIRRIRSFYDGRISFGALDANGTALDLLTANSMAESLGSVPPKIRPEDLQTCFKNSPGRTTGERLNDVVEYIRQHEKALVRKEPGYINPVLTPGRISCGAHHMLISTALDLSGTVSPLSRESKIADLVINLTADPLFSANMAVKYLNRSIARHQADPPLVAATYNAGSPRPDPTNSWNLKQYGSHIDRWTAFYNTSRALAAAPATVPAPVATAEPVPERTKPLEIRVVRKDFTPQSTVGDLFIDEAYHCHTLEDVVRTGEKVFGQTAIPAGRYEVVMSMSNRFKKVMPELKNVPGFAGVRIHKGNTAENTEGCLLVGMEKGPDRIWNCTPAYDGLVRRIEGALPGGRVFITIS